MDATLVERLLRVPPEERRTLYTRLSFDERMALASVLDEELRNPWRRYVNDPVGFVERGLNESVWSKQQEILRSIRDNKRTAVPACHAPGKSHIAARAVAWWGSVHEPGTALAITTATTFRQVRAVLWPHIRRVVNRHGLPGKTVTTEWKIGTEIVSFGFSAGDNDETAVQGVHVPHLLIVIDEAGGISHQLGQAFEALMTGDHTRMLAIGNPATDHEGSWFEHACSSALWNTIRIPAAATPNFTGEDAGVCRSCPPNVPEHSVTTHLVDRQWVSDVVNEFGDDSPFVQARVYAEFPRYTTNKVIPLSWLEQAVENENPIPSREIRLGVDVASDGGDEFVIAWADGYAVSIHHRSAGKQNENAVDVAAVVLEAIRAAADEHVARGVTVPVRVKIDAIGLGWGVVSTLQRWAEEGTHGATIVPVNVAERAAESDKFVNQRAEMWWNARTLFQPTEVDGTERQDVRLDVDRQTIAQLAGPLYSVNSAGRVFIERKADMKRRGLTSPDRGEAVLLALYEPPDTHREPDALYTPVSASDGSAWRM